MKCRSWKYWHLKIPYYIALVFVVYYEFHSMVFSGFSGFRFCRKLSHTETQKGKDRLIEHNVHTVFFWSREFCINQQYLCQLRFVLYPLLILLLHNLCHVNFFPCFYGQDAEAIIAIAIVCPLLQVGHQRCHYFRYRIWYSGMGLLPLLVVPCYYI